MIDFIVSCTVNNIFVQECVSAIQGHPRSLILLGLPIESAFATSVLSCTVSEILHAFVLMVMQWSPRSCSTLFLLDQIGIAHVGVSPSRNLKIINREIIFEAGLFQPIIPRPICDHGTWIGYHRQMDGRRTDGRTDGQTQTDDVLWYNRALASRGKKEISTRYTLGVRKYFFQTE